MAVRSITVCFLLLVAGMTVFGEEEWPEFRGPTGQGISSATGLATHWSETENITWKTPIQGLGWSSPSIVGNQIWLTTATDNGKSLRALCYAVDSGELLQDVEVFRHDEPGAIHQKNSFASPTPIIANDRVYLHFGALGTAALSTDGHILWKKQIEYSHRHGSGGSPVLFKNLLIINCDGFDEQFVVALDVQTGNEVWRVPREARHAYATPLIIDVEGTPQLISTGADRTIAYVPETGEILWWIAYDGYSLVPRPVYGHGLVYICSGYNTPWIYAVRPTGHGDVTKTHIEWSTRRGAPLTPSPVIAGDEIYFMTDRGVASCVDAKTGTLHWQQRLGGDFSASPVFADGKIYFQSEEGVTTVIAPGKEYKELARNTLPGKTFASYAIVGKAIYLRSDTHLYRIEEKAK